MTKTTGLMQDLEKTRDELRVKLHLASMEAKEEWDELESKWESFSARARLDDTSEDVGAALGVLGEELKRGYARIKAALTAK